MSIFEDGVVVVTGAGNGMGRSIANAMARAGSDVVVSDIDDAAAERVAAEIRTATGRRAIAVRIDVTKRADIEALADRAFDAFGRVTVLVNHAGGGLRPYRTIWDASLSDLEWTMDVNFWGVVHGIRSFLPRMLEQPGRKHFVNTSSMVALMQMGGHGAYAAAKGAIDGLSGSLRQEGELLNFGVTLLYPGRFTKEGAPTDSYRDPDEVGNRVVRPWSDYVDAAAQSQSIARRNPTTGGVYDPADEGVKVPGDPTTVGPMVVRAVLANRPFCFTHAGAEPLVERRMREYIDAYHPL